MAISTNGTVIARLAGGLYNQTLSNATYNEVVAVVKSAADINTLANDLYARDFASKTDLAVATTLVSNLGLSGVTGLNNWVAAQLTAAGSAKGTKIVSLLNDLSNLTSDATYGSYATAFNTKTDAALALAQTSASKGGDFNAAATLAAANAAAAAAAEAAAKVVSDAAAAAAKAAADAAAAKVIADAEAAAKAPQKFTLTTDLDTGSSFTGGAGNDSFTAVISTTSDIGTFTDGDSLVGGAGTDTLTISIASSADDTTQPVISTDGIETLSVTNNNNVATTLSAVQMVGLTSVKVTGGQSDLTVSGSETILNTELVSTNKNLTVSAVSTSVLGAADVASVTLTGVASTAAVTVTNNGVETLNVALNGARSGSATDSTLKVTLASNELETVNVTGAAAARLVADLTGADNATQVAVFNASAATGAIIATVTTGASGKGSVTGGSGSDTIAVLDGSNSASASVTQYITVTGGAGTDTFVGNGAYVTAATVQAGANVSGFEVASGTIDARAFPSNTFTSSTGAGSYTKMGSTFTTSTMEATGSLTVSRASTTTTTDALTVNLAATTSTTVTLSAADEETLTFNAAGSVAGVTHTVGVTAAQLQNVVATGSNALSLGTLGSTSTAVKSIDASAHTGSAFTVNASASTVAVTVKGSAGVPVALTDVVNTITTGSGADSVTGGAYKDSIVGGLGADTLDGGAGNDTLDGGGAADSLLGGDGNDSLLGDIGNDYLNGGAGNDVIDTGSGSDTVLGAEGNDTIYNPNISADDNVDGGTGTDVLSANSIGSDLVIADYADVSGDMAVTMKDVETAYIQFANTASNTSTADVPLSNETLDLTAVTGLTTLWLDIDSSTQGSGSLTVKNFSGSTINLTDTDAVERLTIDGTGKDVTVNLRSTATTNVASANVFTGFENLTISGTSYTTDSTGISTSLTNGLYGITAAAATGVTISTSGSTSTVGANANALIVGASTLTAAQTVTLSAGAYDTLASGVVTAGTEVVTLNLTVGQSGSLLAGDGSTSDDIVMTGASLNATNINVGIGGTLTDNATGELEIAATSIGKLTATLSASSATDLSINANIATGSTITMEAGSSLSSTALGGSGTSSLTLSGTGNFDTAVTLAGTAFTFNASGLVDSSGVQVTGGTGNDAITGTAYADSIIGGDGNDTLSVGAGADTVSGGNGNDSITLTDAVDSADAVRYSFAETGYDTITGFTEGTGADVIWIGGAAGILANGAGTTTYQNTDITLDSLTAYFAEINVATYDTTAELTYATGSTGLIYEITGATLSATDAIVATSVATFINNVIDFANTTAAGAAQLLFAISDGTDSYLWYYNGATADVTVDAGEVTLIAKILGVATAGFTSNDFVG